RTATTGNSPRSGAIRRGQICAVVVEVRPPSVLTARRKRRPSRVILRALRKGLPPSNVFRVRTSPPPRQWRRATRDGQTERRGGLQVNHGSKLVGRWTG